MKLLSTLGIALAVGQLAHAADCIGVALTAIPGCATSCFLNGAPSVGCSGTDFDCQCAQEAALYAAVEGCVSSSCPEASFQAVIDGASSVCACASPSAIASGSGSMTVSGTVGSIASNTVSLPASTPASASATATATSGGGTSTTSGAAGGGIAGGGAGWTPTSVSNRATATAISAAHHQMTFDLRPFGCAVAVFIAAFALI